MAEIFGAVAAGIAVCHELSRLAKVIQEVTKKVQNARKDISDLSDEAIIFTGLYETFLQSCESNPEACAGAASSISCLKSWAESTVKDLGKLLDQLDPLRLDTAYRYSLSHTIKSHWKWLVSTKSVNLLRVSLNVARQSISGFSNLMCFEKLNEELKILRKALTNPRERRKIERKFNMRLKDKIEMVKNRIEITQSVHHTNQRLLKEAEDEVTLCQKNTSAAETVAATEKLLDFTRTFDTYAEEVLPAEQPSRRTHSSTSSGVSGSTSGSAFGRRTSSSISSDSHVSRRNPLASSSPESDSSIVFIDISQPAPERQHVKPPETPTLPRPSQTNVNAKHNNTAPRPPTQSARSHNIYLPRAKRIGRHTIKLQDMQVLINNHPLSSPSYAIASRFFEALLTHRDKLDVLDQALANQGPGETWHGIPGWIVHFDRVTMQAESFGIWDV